MNYRIKTRVGETTVRTYNGYGNFFMTSVHKNECRIESAITLFEVEAVEKHFAMCAKYFQENEDGIQGNSDS